MGEGYEGWAIVELMGHRRMAGKISEATIAGAPLLRIDVPKADGDGTFATQFYGGSAIYCITPTSEEMAKVVARTAQPAPVALWELRLPSGSTTLSSDDDEDEGDYPAPQSAPIAGRPTWIRNGIRVDGINGHVGQEGILERSLPAGEGRSRERWAVTGAGCVCIWAGDDVEIDGSWKPSKEPSQSDVPC